jgi:hypothetical protein
LLTSAVLLVGKIVMADRREEFGAMDVRLRSFPADSASVVSSWATTDEEVVMWCGLRAAPVPPRQINAWAREHGVQPFGMYRGGRLVAYGELWVDDDEAEVELRGSSSIPPNEARAWAGDSRRSWPAWPGPGTRGSSCGSIRTTSPLGAATPRRASSPSSLIRRRPGTPPSRSTTSG